jgi:threonine/homoserine/homoserine lactone efflux protein
MIPLLAGVVTGFVSSIPPGGPVAVMILSEGLRRHTRTAHAATAGTVAPLTVWSTLGWLGADRLIPVGWVTSGRLVSAMLLLVVGMILVARPAVARAPATARQAFLTAFAGMGLNPALPLNYAAAAALWLAAGVPAGGSTGAVAFGVGVASGAAAWYTLAIAGLSRTQLSESAVAWMRRGLGMFAIGAGLWMAITLPIR